VWVTNRAILRRYRIEISSVKDLLFYFLLAWTVMMLVFAWLYFFIPRLQISEAFVTSYFILLGVYITHKEVSRWVGIPMKIKPGELLVYTWWGSLFAMFFIGFFFSLDVPYEIRQVAYEVLAAFLASEISKNINIYRKDHSTIITTLPVPIPPKNKKNH